MPITLNAQPEPFTFAPENAALIVVDMQNGFASRGGYLDRAGFDISKAGTVIANCGRLLPLARAAGIAIVYLQMGWHPDLHDAGSANGGMAHKSIALRYMRDDPSRLGTAITRGSWDYAIVDALIPQSGDILVPKTRLSGFFGTNLDSILRARHIDTLLYVGIATNVCVESTIRDALFRDYKNLLIEDATAATGPDYVADATKFNVQRFLGWVTTTDLVCRCLSEISHGRTIA